MSRIEAIHLTLLISILVLVIVRMVWQIQDRRDRNE
jgi:cytochrome b561